MTTQNKILAGLTVALLGGPAVSAWAQVPYDPPTAQRAAPNVMLMIDATRTNLINGSNCRGECHFEDSVGDEHSQLYNFGETRLQLARRVLTGGWGWNTTGRDRTNTFSADASVRRDGVMDQYFVRWGVIYYDGLGPRLALNPTLNNALAQQRVIDFAQPGYGENIGNALVSPALNSWMPYYRTTRCCSNSMQPLLIPDGNAATTPFFAEASGAGGRMTEALQYVRDYFDSTGAFPQWNPPGPNSLVSMGVPPVTPIGNFFRGDAANVLANDLPAGCRRNFAIMLTDGNGAGDHNSQSRMEVASEIHNMQRNDGSTPPDYLANQLFVVHFGVDASNTNTLGDANDVADCGFDGTCGDGPGAFEGAPGGEINDLTPMYAAFSAIFQLVLSGTYLASAPTITRAGDRVVTSSFRIQNCQGALPNQCNIGRIGDLRMEEYVYPTPTSLGVVDDIVNFSAILRSQRWDNRNLFTGHTNMTDTRCGRTASCSSNNAEWRPILPTTSPGDDTPISPPGARTHAEFLRGHPSALFANGVMRSDTRNGTSGAASGRDPYKLMDIANSQPVVVGAPAGIGEDIERWEQFLSLDLSRQMRTVGDGTNGWIQKAGSALIPSPGTMTVEDRDQVVYIGGNDGLLHAFLSGVASGSPTAGRTANYALNGGDICTAAPATPFPPQVNISGCIGQELWAYSPRLVQPYWSNIRSGHYFMVDGTPVVSDVLFTKHRNTPGPTCDILHDNSCDNRWEYRTVLLQCLGGGGPGCFALDVTNPYQPEPLWERSLVVPGTTRGTSTSRPQIVRVRRTVGGRVIPYYVGIMGGGLNESNGTARQGTVIALGLEDGEWYASTGTELGSADFAGAPTCLDTDGDSYTDTCYIATTDASIYKVRIGSLDFGAGGTSGQITMERFFDGRQRLLAIGQSAAVANAIRAYGRVVATFDRNRDIRIFFATGNFEDVQNANEQNFFFGVIDQTPEAAPNTWTNALNNGRSVTACSGDGVIALPTGEKSVFDPVISNGVVVFTSYRPNSNPCLQGTGYLNGVTVDACSNGIDSDGVGGPDSGAPGGTRQSYTGLPVAPVINERTGGITVSTDAGGATANQGFTRRLPSPPVTKLWWRMVR